MRVLLFLLLLLLSAPTGAQSIIIDKFTAGPNGKFVFRSDFCEDCKCCLPTPPELRALLGEKYGRAVQNRPLAIERPVDEKLIRSLGGDVHQNLSTFNNLLANPGNTVDFCALCKCCIKSNNEVLIKKPELVPDMYRFYQ